jgi:hypothetical protein
MLLSDPENHYSHFSRKWWPWPTWMDTGSSSRDSGTYYKYPERDIQGL